MKKVNFFNFPNYNIIIKKVNDTQNIKSPKTNCRIRRAKFKLWCSSINNLEDKLAVKVTFKS